MVYTWHHHIPGIGIEDKWPPKFSYLFSLDAPKHNMAWPQLYAISRQSIIKITFTGAIACLIFFGYIPGI